MLVYIFLWILSVFLNTIIQIDQSSLLYPQVLSWAKETVARINREEITQILWFRNVFPKSKFVPWDCFYTADYTEAKIWNFEKDGLSVLRPKRSDMLIYKYSFSSWKNYIDLYLEDTLNCVEMNNNDVLLFDSSDTWLGRDMWFGRLSAGEKFNDRMIAYKRASYFWENFNKLRQEGKATFYTLGRREWNKCNCMGNSARQTILFRTEWSPNYYLIENVPLDSYPLCPSIAFDINNLDGTSSFENNLKADI